jgi:hypothetical protein
MEIAIQAFHPEQISPEWIRIEADLQHHPGMHRRGAFSLILDAVVKRLNGDVLFNE